MSIVITSEGMDVALGRMQDVLEALGGKGAGIAIARALNRSLQAARTGRRASPRRHIRPNMMSCGPIWRSGVPTAAAWKAP